MPGGDRNQKEEPEQKLPEAENDVQSTQDVEDDMSDLFEDSDNMMITDEAIAVMAGVAASEVKGVASMSGGFARRDCRSIRTQKSFQGRKGCYQKRCDNSRFIRHCEIWLPNSRPCL